MSNILTKLATLRTQVSSKWQIYALFFLGLLTYVYWDLLIHLDENLLDRLDYPYIVWVIKGNIDSLTIGNLSNYFETKGFYPHPYGLLFSDILLPQALIVLPIYLLTGNIILSFNLIYIMTYILNYLSAYLLWRHFFKNSFLACIGALLIVFGPFFHMQMAHFQMQSYWIGFFALLLMFRVIDRSTDSKTTRINKNYLFTAASAGVLLGIQFTASVYLYVFFAAFTFIIWCATIIMTPHVRTRYIHGALIMYGSMSLVITPFVKAYYTMKHYYAMERDISEIILYSAHLSDYVFTQMYTSLFYRLPIWNLWNHFDKHIIGEKAAFPGFFLMIFAFIGLFTIASRLKGKPLTISLPLDRLTVIFLLTSIVGFLGSLGPRLSFNGTYAHIPTPYLAGLKIFPMLDGIRCPTRWEFLLIISLVFLSLRGIHRISQLSIFKKDMVKFVAGTLVLCWIVFEYLPAPVSTYSIPQLSEQHRILKERCDGDAQTVVLEYPVTHFNAFGGIVEGLGYISSRQFAQVLHECYLMNGYSGFIPNQVFTLEQSMNGIIAASEVDTLHAFLKQQDVDIVVFNKTNTLPEYRSGYESLMLKLIKDPRFYMLSNDMFEVKP